MNVAPDVTPANGFEGAEKKLEIAFHFTSDCKVGLRAVPAERWSNILDLVQCSIVSCTKNDFFDAYVLSESSLFVYPYKIILKTCGRTILLRCLEPMIALAKEVCNVVPDFAFFSRKSFLYPDEQAYPHTSFDAEVEFLNNHFKGGQSYKLGPAESDHTWHLYVCDLREREVEGDQTFEIMMTDLDPTVMKQFYKKEHSLTAQELTIKSGIADLLPGSTTDPFLFNPCGYSVNGLLDDAYFTVHITPEPHCSFVSFETNVARENFVDLAAYTLEVFKPGKATITLFADHNAKSGPSTSSALDGKKLVEKASTYHLSHASCTQFEDPYDVTVLYLENQAQ